MKDLVNSEAHLDAPSVALGVTLFALSFGLAEIAIDTVLGAISLIIAVAAAVVFVARQLACQHPLIELSPMRRVSFWPAAIFALVSLMSMFSMSVLLPLYLEGACGITAFMAGVVMLIPVLCNAASTLISGRIMDKCGGWPLYSLGLRASSGLCARQDLRFDVLHCCDVFCVSSGVHRCRYVALSFSDGWIAYASAA